MQSKEKTIDKENRLLARYKKQRSFKPYAIYPLVVVILIILASATDEMCSNIQGDLQSAIITDFFGNLSGLEYSQAADKFVLITTLASVSSLISPFYKSLADRFGRKLFLWLNVLGMSIGMLFCFWSPNLIVYLIGFFIMSFFVTHDMQVVYVFEVAPAKKRASLYGFTKCIGTLSVILLPILRKAFITSGDTTSWRKVFLIPAILGIVFAFLIFALVKESNVFLDGRIAYLSRPYEDRQKELKQEKEDKKSQTTHKKGVFPAIKYIFSHHDLKYVAITQIFVGLAFAAMSNYYSSILKNFMWSEENISDVLLLFSTIYALSMLAAGLLADKFGRRKTIIGCLGIALPGFALFVTGANLQWNPFLLGVIMSLYRSGLYITYDYLTLIASEMCPTEIRGSVMGGESLCSYLAVAAGLGLTSLVMIKLITGYACLVIGLPFAAIALFFAFRFLKESKGADLETIQ